MSPTETPETPLARLAAVVRQMAKGPLVQARYEHGGGRLYREDGKDRSLIADTYHEGDREAVNSWYVCADALLAVVGAADLALTVGHDHFTRLRDDCPRCSAEDAYDVARAALDAAIGEG